MSATQTLEGSPLACGTQNGPYKISGQALPLYNVPSVLLWGGGRTDMYWRGPAPSSVQVPSLLSATSTSLTVTVPLAGIKGQTPYNFLLRISQNPAGPFTQVDGGVQVGGNIQWTAPGLQASTAYYVVLEVSNGFGSDVTAVSPAYSTSA